MQNVVVNINGQIIASEHPELDAKVSVFDRSFLYGDSLYEVARTYSGRFFALDEHLKRLEASASLCRMVLGQSLEHYAAEIQRTFDEFHEKKPDSEAYCRLIVSRGVGTIGFGLECLLTPTQYVIIVQPLQSYSSAEFRKGRKLQVAHRLRNDRRALDPAMKSGNYLNSVLAYLEATSEDFDDAILLNADGHVTEGTTFNVGYVRRGIVATPPLDIGILDGITRRWIIEVAAELGIPVREVRFPKERLYEADEVFMTSSIREVFPVPQVDQHKIGNGSPGPITLKLAEGLRKKIKQVT